MYRPPYSPTSNRGPLIEVPCIKGRLLIEDLQYSNSLRSRNLEEIKAEINNCETATDTNGEEGILNIVHPIVNPDIQPDFEETSNLDKIHKRVVEFFPTVELFKDVSDDNDVISKEQIYSRFVIIGILITTIVCLVPLVQLIQILIRTKTVMVVKPNIQKEEDSLCEFLITSSVQFD